MEETKGKVILAVGAHADDIDFGASGSIAKWASEGATIYYLILTDGSKGTEDKTIKHEDLIAMRQKEQKDAAWVLGAKEVFFLNYVDGELENSMAVRRDIVKIIRKVKPDVVICWDPTYVYDAEMGRVNHPDHRMAGQATLDAVFPFSRNSRTFPELLEEGLELHHVKDILLMNVPKATLFVDITDYLDKKLEALKCHDSQFDDYEKVKERVTERAQKLGEKCNAQYAEGFVRITLAS